MCSLPGHDAPPLGGRWASGSGRQGTPDGWIALSTSTRNLSTDVRSAPCCAQAAGVGRGSMTRWVLSSSRGASRSAVCAAIRPSEESALPAPEATVAASVQIHSRTPRARRPARRRPAGRPRSRPARSTSGPAVPGQISQPHLRMLQRGQRAAQPGLRLAGDPPAGLSRALSSVRASCRSARATSSPSARAWPDGGRPPPATIRPAAPRRGSAEHPHPTGQLGDRSLAGCDVQGWGDQQVHQDPDDGTDQSLEHPAERRVLGAADGQDQHRADRHLQQVRPQAEQPAGDQGDPHDQPEAPPGQPRDTRETRRTRTPATTLTIRSRP